jgi:hypothetical protein
MAAQFRERPAQTGQLCAAASPEVGQIVDFDSTSCPCRAIIDLPYF